MKTYFALLSPYGKNSPVIGGVQVTVIRTFDVSALLCELNVEQILVPPVIRDGMTVI